MSRSYTATDTEVRAALVTWDTPTGIATRLRMKPSEIKQRIERLKRQAYGVILERDGEVRWNPTPLQIIERPDTPLHPTLPPESDLTRHEKLAFRALSTTKLRTATTIAGATGLTYVEALGALERLVSKHWVERDEEKDPTLRYRRVI